MNKAIEWFIEKLKGIKKQGFHGEVNLKFQDGDMTYVKTTKGEFPPKDNLKKKED